jgi:hypothetical protein
MARGFLPATTSGLAKVWMIAILVVAGLAIRKSVALLWFAAHVSGLFLIFTSLWIGGFRHYGLVLIATIASLWLGMETGGKSRVTFLAIAMLNVSLALSIPLALKFAWSDFTKNYSGSREMARYILRSGHEGAEIAAHPPAQSAAVLPYLPRRMFWYPALGRSGSYMSWDADYRKAQSLPVERAAQAALSTFGDRPWLFLAASPLGRPEEHELTLLYATHQPLVEPRDAEPWPNDERYWLYGSRRMSPAPRR